jgi:HMG (high mobility group) box
MNEPTCPSRAFHIFDRYQRANEPSLQGKPGSIPLLKTSKKEEIKRRWKALTQEGRKPYDDLAKADKLRYENEMKIYEEMVSVNTEDENVSVRRPRRSLRLKNPPLNALALLNPNTEDVSGFIKRPRRSLREKKPLLKSSYGKASTVSKKNRKDDAYCRFGGSFVASEQDSSHSDPPLTAFAVLNPDMEDENGSVKRPQPSLRAKKTRLTSGDGKPLAVSKKNRKDDAYCRFGGSFVASEQESSHSDPPLTALDVPNHSEGFDVPTPGSTVSSDNSDLSLTEFDVGSLD